MMDLYNDCSIFLSRVLEVTIKKNLKINRLRFDNTGR